MMEHVPRATYRIQFNPGFTFSAAGEIVEYLRELGVSHIYASPIFASRSGSSHGYDVIDHNRINPELGGDEGFFRLRRRMREVGLGWLQDFVPNHMAYDSGNILLMDVLEKGVASEYSRFFDIDWKYPYTGLRGNILAPFLDGTYGDVLERGEIKVEFDGARFRIRCQEMRFPLARRSYGLILERVVRTLSRDKQADPRLVRRLGSLIKASSSPGRGGRFSNVLVEAKTKELFRHSEVFRRALARALKSINGRPGHPASFDLLDRILSSQFYRLAFWKVGAEELNYRRFFTVNELISLRVEKDDVFEKIHRLLIELVRRGEIDGVRVDHVDGLFDPSAYLRRLAERVNGAYLVVEKILHPREELPSAWPVAGSTGYDFLCRVNGLFCDPSGERKMTRIYRDFTGMEKSFRAVAAEKKRLIAGRHMLGDIDNLSRQIKDLLARDRHGRDITMYGLRRALVEIMVQFPVYRTYVGPARTGEEDRSQVEEAIRRAWGELEAFHHELEVLRRYLLPEIVSPSTGRGKKLVNFAMRFQQFTGPLAAKGVEDTAFYCYNRLISLNEVGGEPEYFGVRPEEFHAFLSRRRDTLPDSLNATATHDTKRGEDARARINVLSEIPERWRALVKNWSRINRTQRVKAGGGTVPDRNEEYFLYQVLLGAWPFDSSGLDDFRRRLKEYLVKALREAKVQTDWHQPVREYEDAYLAFVDRLLEPEPDNRFMEEFLPFQKEVAWWGVFNSLGQLTIKATAPGVPDFYQGTELWDLSFVDPDNRRPVDYGARIQGLKWIRNRWEKDKLGLIEDLLSRPGDGMVKLFLTWRLLRTRAENESLFKEGEYIPLAVEGKPAFAFARRCRSWALTVVPLRLASLVKKGEVPVGREVWGESVILLPEGSPERWINAVTGETVTAKEGRLLSAEVFSLFPAALLLAAGKREAKGGR